ncbi:peptidase S8/S53 domain-containing protein [Hypoxylon fuscum]|nr:peptidase S8/S53 domain-containing protein [Hypoxylon fuscum]
MDLGYPTHVIHYSTGGRGEKIDHNGDLVLFNQSDNKPYLQFFQYLLDLSDEEITHVVSISYADDEQSVPVPCALRVCDMLALVAARGFTKRMMLFPMFPASCPYVTAVAATVSTLPFEGAMFSTDGFQVGLYNETSQVFPGLRGYETNVLGTSASTPVVAALVAPINDSRLKIPNCVLGEEIEPGWKSAKGYDCITGLGSVSDFGRLLDVLE